jgi:hypothetical protein
MVGWPHLVIWPGDAAFLAAFRLAINPCRGQLPFVFCELCLLCLFSQGVSEKFRKRVAVSVGASRSSGHCLNHRNSHQLAFSEMVFPAPSGPKPAAVTHYKPSQREFSFR